IHSTREVCLSPAREGPESDLATTARQAVSCQGLHGMDRRFSTFIALSALVLLVNILVMKWLAPPPGQQPVAQNQDAEKDRAEDERPRKPKKPKQGAAAGNAEEDQADVGAADKARPDKAQVKAPAKEV